MLTAHSCTTVSVVFQASVSSTPDANYGAFVFFQQALTIITSWAAGYVLPVPERRRQTSWWASSLRSPGTTRRAGLDLWHRAHDIIAAASSATSVPFSVYESPPSIASSWGVFSKVDPWGGAVATGVHTYRCWRDDACKLFLVSCNCILTNMHKSHSDQDFN